MIFSYENLVILLSNFDLDQINFQSENSIRLDLLNNSKKMSAPNVTYPTLEYLWMLKPKKLFVKSV